MKRPPELESDRGREAWNAIAAAATGDVPTLRRLIDRDPTLIRGAYGYPPPVYLAVREGHLDATRVLLDAGAETARNFHGDMLLDVARERGFHDIATLLEGTRDRSRRVAPANTHTDHPIHAAAEAGDIRRVRALLDADPALLHRSDRSGGTPLHRAVLGRASTVVALLLDRGADVNAIHGDGLGSAAGYAPADFQPIDLAIWGGPRRVRPPLWRIAVACVRWGLKSLRGATYRAAMRRRPCDVEMARLLLARGASHDLPIASSLGDLDRVTAILDRDPSRISEVRPNGRRALSAATEFGHEAIVRLLLQRGADPTWPDADDAPRGAALHAAARAGDRTLVELLLAHGADPNGFVDAAGNAVFAAKTPELRALLMAHGGRVDPFDLVWMGEDDEVMRRVKEDPASAYAGCGGVFTAVCTLGKRDLMMRLLDAGVRVPPVAAGCQSYLLEQPDMLRVLLARGALDPDYPTWQNATLLHALCNRDVRGRTMDHRTECAAILLDAGAAISPRDDDSKSTPLAWAARNNVLDMVEFLLARGAPTNVPDDPPWATPLAWATRRGHRQIVELLRRAGATA